ncbi:MAG: peptidylprolyl isomerase [Porticoccaceae bacterium]|nr:peptidylprolyl isomerase [Porticoccaceae bacterium]
MKTLTRKHALRALALTTSLTIGSLCSAEQVFLDRTIAIVGDNVVMESELNSRIKDVVQRLRQQPNVTLPPEAELKKQVLEQLVDERLILNFAESRGIRIADQQVNQHLQTLAARQGLTLDQLVEMVHQNGDSLADLRRNIHDQLVIQMIDEQAIKANIPVSLQEIEQLMASEEGQASTSASYQVGHILLPLAASASKENVIAATANADGLVKQLRDGANFQQFAINHSKGPNALKGGDLGWKKPLQLPAKFRPVVEELEVGDISDPIRSDAGLHILKVHDRKGGEQQMMLQQHKVRHILVKTNAIRDDEAAYNQLSELRQRIADGEDFADLAKEFSEDPGSKQQGGDIGWNTVEEGRLVPEFLQMMQSVELGDTSYPFRSEFGWHILEVTERREKDFGKTAMQNRFAEAIQNSKFDEEKAIWLQEMRNDFYIELKL